MTPEQLDRYSRHITLPQIGEQGQQTLLDSRVLIVGLGGLGSPAAMYLAAAGIGKLVLADFDQVEVSNLQRQIAHTTGRVGQLKTHSARTASLEINPEIHVETVDFAVDDDDLDPLVANVDLVVEGSDNFDTRFAVNRACVRHRKPLVSGAAIRMDAQVSVFKGYLPDSPCYACLYGQASGSADTCALTGVLGPFVGMIGCLQAVEAIKVLTAAGRSLQGRLLLLDGLNMEWQEIVLQKNPDCSICGSGAKNRA